VRASLVGLDEVKVYGSVVARAGRCAAHKAIAVRHLATVGCMALAFGLASPSLALAWGNEGHRIVCEIAFQEMSRPARDAVKDLIAHDREYRVFADACIWPDHPRKRASEHFINVPRTFKDIHAANCPEADRCLFTAITQDANTLKNKNAPVGARLEALKYLGHWVGDIHQPLHVSFSDDRGGNNIDVDGTCMDTLHSVWDTCLIEEQLGTGEPRAIAENLRATVTDAERKQWAKSKPVDWANESYQITIAAPVDYCVMSDGACRYEANNERLDQGEPRKTVVVNEAYVTTNGPKVKDQLTKAGVRLGKMLDDLLGGP
jgi:hypothetical protein